MQTIKVFKYSGEGSQIESMCLLRCYCLPYFNIPTLTFKKSNVLHVVLQRMLTILLECLLCSVDSVVESSHPDESPNTKACHDDDNKHKYHHDHRASNRTNHSTHHLPSVAIPRVGVDVTVG